MNIYCISYIHLHIHIRSYMSELPRTNSKCRWVSDERVPESDGLSRDLCQNVICACCLCTHIYVHTNIWIHTHKHNHIHKYIHIVCGFRRIMSEHVLCGISLQTNVYIHNYIRTHKYIHIVADEFSCTHMYTYTTQYVIWVCCLYTHMCTYTNTHTLWVVGFLASRNVIVARCVCAHIKTCTWNSHLYRYTQANPRACKYTHIHAYTHSLTDTHICTHTHLCANTCTHTQTNTLTPTHQHTHIHMRTRTYTYTPALIVLIVWYNI